MLITNKFIPDPEMLKGVDILVVDNDRDSRDLYGLLLESYGAIVTKSSSIQAGLDLLNEYVPSMMLCEIRFLGESVYPLIQKARFLESGSGRLIPILGTSTFPLSSLAQELQIKIEAYLLKPIDLDYLLEEVWNLLLLSKVLALPNSECCPKKPLLDKVLQMRFPITALALAAISFSFNSLNS